MPHVRVARLDALSADAPTLVVIDGRRVALVRRGDVVHALDDSCPHAGGPLSEGRVNDGTLACPYHGWIWSLADGRCVAPARDARVSVYPARVENGDVWIDLP
jgi:nitrite reductase/ring-hydroxylating ferredoxin subunit